MSFTGTKNGDGNFLNNPKFHTFVRLHFQSIASQHRYLSLKTQNMNTTQNPGHLGRKISKIRELRGMKQEALAIALGVSQQTVSNIENNENVEEALLEKVAQALEVSVEGIKNFSEENVLNIISNTFNDSAMLNAVNVQPTFNPLDKVVALFEEKEKLYERLLKAEKEKVEYLEKLFSK